MLLQGGRPLRFAPGQFVWLKLGGIAPHKDHPFSISSAPDPSGSLRFVIKEAGDFTETIATWRAGALAYVDGPYGDFRIPAEAQAVVMIAGGIGIAPFLGLLAACAQQGETRPIRLIYAERDVTQMVAFEALSGCERLDDFAQILMVEKPHEGWAGMVGRLDSRGFAQALACEAVAKVANRAHFMICGPSRMMDGVETSLLARGVPMKRVQSEHFQYDFSGRSPRARAIRRGWLALSAVLLLLSVLVTAWA